MVRLSELLVETEVKSVSGGDPFVISLCANSATCAHGSVFFALRGGSFDGHNHAEEAIKNGATVLVVERLLPFEVSQVLVKDARVAMSTMSSAFYGFPSRRLKLVGLTGTNGKTTTSYIVRNIAKACGYKTGLIGTTAVYYGDKLEQSVLTTPDPIDLHRIFARMVKEGVDVVIMEVSAHALALNKLCGVTFDIVAFTNLSQDHLDFFGDMQTYKQAKLKLFTSQMAKMAIVNADDECGREIATLSAQQGIETYTYGCNVPTDVFAINYSSGTFGQKYVLNVFDNITDIAFRLPGRFNMYNTLCASTIGFKLGANVSQIACAIAATEFVPGRFNVISADDFTVIVDYAHTPDGLKNILQCVDEIAQARVITVFGCGGDRDKEKRAEMGRIAGEFSDYTIITSDNPRHEKPEEIINQIEVGIKRTGARYIKLTDRRTAIEYAIRLASPRDIVIVAGKGDERYLDIMGTKLPYYDVDEVKRAISIKTRSTPLNEEQC